MRPDQIRHIADLISEDPDEVAHGYVDNVEQDTEENTNFRKVLYTGHNIQLVLMSLQPGEDIGAETHPDVDQFFRVESGTGQVTINGKSQAIQTGSGIIIPAGAKHDLTNTGEETLQLYTLYAPPNHQDQIVRDTKADAEKNPEEYDGETTE